LEELAARFEIKRVSRRTVAFDRRDLDWFNRRWIGSLDEEAATALLAPHWRAAYGLSERSAGTALSPHDWERTLALAIRDELALPGQCVEQARFAFVDELTLDAGSQAVLSRPYANPILRAFADELPSVFPFQFDPLDAFCRQLRLRFKDALGIRSRDVMYVLRAALAGRQDGPCLVVICQLLGPERCIQRARLAIGRA
jgi:glutamyl/glutaminyl-tRNA synthetase